MPYSINLLAQQLLAHTCLNLPFIAYFLKSKHYFLTFQNDRIAIDRYTDPWPCLEINHINKPERMLRQVKKETILALGNILPSSKFCGDSATVKQPSLNMSYKDTKFNKGSYLHIKNQQKQKWYRDILYRKLFDTFYFLVQGGGGSKSKAQPAPAAPPQPAPAPAPSQPPAADVEPIARSKF